MDRSDSSLGTTPPARPLRLRPPSLLTPSEAQPLDDPQACPKCGARLSSPASLGYCTACGYCQSLHDVQLPALEQTPTPPKPKDWQVVSQAVLGLPSWLWVLTTGVGAVILYSFATGHTLPESGRQRAVWGSAQLVGGLLVFFLAQFWALVRLAPLDPTLGTIDLCGVSVRLWQRALSEQPKNCWPVWLAAWGLVAAFCAVFLIGGFGYWFSGAAVDANGLSPLKQ